MLDAKSYCPRADSDTKEPGDFEDIFVLQKYALKPGKLSNEDEREIATLLSKWIGLFPKKPSQASTFKIDDYLEYVFDLCEESWLSVVLLKRFFDDLAKSHKSLPSINEIADGLSELRHAANRQWRAAHKAEQQYNEIAKNISGALEAALPGIRVELPTFPDTKDVTSAWKSLWSGPLGNIGDVRRTEQRSLQITRALDAGEVWPAILLYLIWLVAKIPEDKRGRASALHDRLQPENEPVGWHFSPTLMEQVIKQLPSEEGLPDNDPIESWINDVLCSLNATTIFTIEEMWRREGDQ
jgi:hypothetical protein